MKYFWTFFWTFLLIQMLTYVVCAMLGVSFEFQIASILSVVVTFLLFIMSAIIPDGPTEKKSIH